MTSPGERISDAGAGRQGPALPPMDGGSSAGQDPILGYIRIMEAYDLTDDQKAWLIRLGTQRFRNRRRMAYLALAAMLVTLATILAGAIIDGIFGTDIVGRLAAASTLLGVTNSLFAAIIAAYYGISSFRPSS